MPDNKKPPHEHEPREEANTSPPGHFVSDDLRAETARFLDELKQRRRREQPEDEPKLGPPG